jgi:hypothetical protein
MRVVLVTAFRHVSPLCFSPRTVDTYVEDSQLQTKNKISKDKCKKSRSGLCVNKQCWNPKAVKLAYYIWKYHFLSRGLILSSSKPTCRISAVRFFVKYIPPMAFWHGAHSDKCLFQLLIPGLTPVSLLESESWFEIVTQLAETGKRPFSIFIVYILLVAEFAVYLSWVIMMLPWLLHQSRLLDSPTFRE